MEREQSEPFLGEGFLAGAPPAKQRGRLGKRGHGQGTSVSLGPVLVSWLIDAQRSTCLGLLPYLATLCVCLPRCRSCSVVRPPKAAPEAYGLVNGRAASRGRAMPFGIRRFHGC
ncbi:uncharacterized protein BJX67DRAFT_356579 [Aspergillus lucknowensis]|uniref:Uncharacterized protein n=1 Tax=Aspergillus lucknowensis TaxID=176173 RepID=A0ABR4LNX8_9EURO